MKQSPSHTFTPSRNHAFTLTLALSLLAPAAQAQDPAAVFHAACAQKAADGDAMAVAGADGWLFLRSELRHIGVGPFWGEAAAKVSRASSPDKADPLPAIVDFSEQLKKAGIDLILMPVPCKALVYPEPLGGPAQGRLDTVHQAFYKQLEARGVTVLDLADAFAKAKGAGPVLYCKTDSHWSPYACELAATRIKDRLGSPAWLRAQSGDFQTAAATRTIAGDLTDGKGAEELPVRVVTSADHPTLEDKGSPVVLLGDSHTLVFHAGQELHGVGAGLADQLAAELGIAVDVVGARGSGATPARMNLQRRAKADASYLSGKKLVIWCFAAREFTESSGWSLVPFGTLTNKMDAAKP
jgi:alginate O-acetyltransferase complex protein AlgJ